MPEAEAATSAISGKAPKPVFKPCYGAKGHFVRCPGTPAPRRRHRRKYSPDANCECPADSRRVDPVKGKGPIEGRGFACIKNTKEGARFVPMKCSTSSPKLLPSLFAKSEKMFPDLHPLNHRDRPAKKPSQAKRQKIDWGKCKCPPDTTLRTTKAGKNQCVTKNNKLVKAICPDGKGGFAGFAKLARR